MRALWIPVVLGVLVGGCHDLPDLGYCGNGVAEQNLGEACDDGGASTRCTATCELACVPVADKPATYVAAANDPNFACPDDTYTCAADSVDVHICRAPSGRFSLATPIFFDVDESPSATDLNGDGYADLVGTNASTITSLFGGPAADALVTGSAQPAPASLGPLRVFERPLRSDTDEYSSTIIVPSSGLAFLNSDGFQYVPEEALKFPVTLEANALTFVTSYPDGAHPLGDVAMYASDGYAAEDADEHRQLHRLAIYTSDAMHTPIIEDDNIPNCNAPTDVDSWTTVGVISAPGQSTFLVVSTKNGSTVWNVCRYTRVGSAWSLEVYAFPTNPPVIGRDDVGRPTIALADVAGDGCGELLYQAGATTRYVAATLGGGNGCEFVPGATVGLAGVLGRLLGAGTLFEPTALVVTAGGIYHRGAGPTWEVELKPQGGVDWASVAFSDVTGDGVPDAVLNRSVDNGALDDLDVVRAGPVLTMYRADTVGPITRLIAGDYDGDGVGDVAMLEGSGDKSRISVAYGIAGGLLSPPRVVTKPLVGLRVERMTRFFWAPTTQPHDGLDDLVIAVDDEDPLTPESKLYSGFMMGDPRRVPTIPRYAPFDAFDRSDADDSAPPIEGGFTSAVAGHFFGPDASVQIAAVASLSRLFVHDYRSGDAWQLIDVYALGPASTRGVNAPIGSVRAGDQTRVVVTGGKAAFRVLQPVAGATTTSPICEGPNEPELKPLAYSGIDIDGDGTDELVVNYASSSLRRLVKVFDLRGCQGGLSLDSSAETFVLENCSQLVKASGRLYALCASGDGNGAAVFELDPDHPMDRTRRIAVIGGVQRFLTAGDFDGDGVVDLAATTSLGNGAAVTLLHQCTTSDLRSCPPP